MQRLYRQYRRTGLVLAATLLMLIGTGLYFVLHQRALIWRAAHDATQDIARGLEASISARFEQSVASLRGVEVDLAAHAISEEAVALAALRNAARYDPLSAYLGVRLRPDAPLLLVDAQGRRAEAALEASVSAQLAPPSAPGPDLRPMLRPSGARDWLMPISLGSAAGVQLVALVPSERILAGMQSLNLLPGSTVALIRRDGLRLLRQTLGMPGIDVQPLAVSPASLVQMQAGDASFEFHSERYGVDFVVGHALSRDLPLHIAVLVPADTLQQRWLAEAAWPAGLLLLGLVGILLFGIGLRRALLDQRHFVQRLRHVANHDTLTGLLNHDAFVRELERALAGAAGHVVVAVLDISNFKDINDTFGHAVGDQALIEIGRRFAGLLANEQGRVARLGGDELAVFGQGLDTPCIEAFSRRLHDCLGEPLQLSGVELELGACIGLAAAPEDGRTASELMRRADIAMRAGKTEFRRVNRYRPELDRFTPDALALKSDFARGLRAGEVGVAFQPKVRLGDGAIVGVEALARWHDPLRGSVPPARFVPLAENSALIHAFTRHMLQLALTHAARWQAAGVVLPVAVNISTNNLLDPAFVDDLRQQLDRTGVPPGLLELELTESAVMKNPEFTLQRLQALRDLGVRLSIDDFGTGYASLSYLKQLPVQALKLDQVFVRELATDRGDQRIVRSAIQLAHGFGMAVVAEGVETAEAAALLREYGCEFAQGWLYARAMPATELERDWLGLGAAGSSTGQEITC